MRKNCIHAEVVEKAVEPAEAIEKVYTCKEVASMYRVHINTVWFWVQTGKLKSIRIGRQYRITKEALAEFETGGA